MCGRGVGNRFIIDSVVFGLPLLYNRQPPDIRQGFNDANASDKAGYHSPDTKSVWGRWNYINILQYLQI